MTQICVSLTEETTAGVVERMADLAGIADLFEVRADFVLDLDLLTILRGRTRPILLTCRAASEGGRLADDDPRRRMTLLEAVKRGFDYVDVEYRSAFVDVMVEKAGRGLVVSYHDLKGTPEDLDGFYAAMRERGADVVKIAVTPRSIRDVGRLLDFAARTAAAGGPPLVPIALGPLGVVTRIAAGRWGAPFTFASAARGAETSPGQIPAAEMADLYRARDVNPLTKVFGVLGTDVVWSLSPVLHNRAFEARRLDAVYVPLQADSLEGFLEALPALALSGFSVTRPFKVDIVPHLQEVEEPAALSGSVNTVVVHDGALRGSTTDGIGVLAPLKKRLDVKGRAVVILGAGGAARAAALALKRKGARVTLVARRSGQAASVASALGCAHAGLPDLPRLAWDVLINATPAGSAAHPDESPFPAKHRPGTVVLDMVYEPLETRFLRDAQQAGCTIIDGLEMLLAQAVAQFETWTGLEAPLDVMKSAALFLAQEQEA
ncbi:MAG: shikimate dehydrogenase [Acidobacteria bacterium]|nr:MAG: shikimate dehydrogenase [Acidobacteriota bacterium]